MSPPRSKQRFLHLLFCDPEKGQGTLPRTGSEIIKQTAEIIQIQNVDSAPINSVCASGRLVHICEFKRCILSRLNHTKTQIISMLCFRKHVVQIPGPAIWGVSGSSGIYKTSWGNIDTNQESGHLLMSHLQFLVFVKNREKSQLVPSQKICYLGLQLDSVENQAQLLSQQRITVFSQYFSSFSAWSYANYQALPATLRFYDLHDISSPAWSADDGEVSTMVSHETEPPHWVQISPVGGAQHVSTEGLPLVESYCVC